MKNAHLTRRFFGIFFLFGWCFVLNNGRSNDNHSKVHLVRGDTGVPLQVFLPTPGPPKVKLLVVGAPKAGTESIHKFLICGGADASHHCCRNTGNGRVCASCLRKMHSSGQPLFKNCGDHEAYTQLDAESVPPALMDQEIVNASDNPSQCYWPQVELLEEMSREAPAAILVLNVRPADHWLKSAENWKVNGYSMRDRLLHCSITGLQRRPTLSNRSLQDEDLMRFYEQHNEKVRLFAKSHPSHTLVEVDIEAPDAGAKLSLGIRSAFNISESCWGHAHDSSKRPQPTRPQISPHPTHPTKNTVTNQTTTAPTNDTAANQTTAA